MAEGPSTGSGRKESRSAPAMWVGGGVPPPGAPLDTGFRRYDDGGCGKYERRRRPAPRPCPGFPLSRERRWGGCAACRYCVGLPHPAPLDSCLRRNDARRRRPLAAHLPWVPAFARTTVGGVCGTRGRVGGGVPFDRLRANGISKRACDVGWWGRAAARRTSGYRLSPVRRLGGVGSSRGGGAPRRAPALGSRFRENDGGGCWGHAGAVGGGGPFDRLRANGIAISL